MTGAREWWTSENRLYDCDCLIDADDPKIPECFGPFKVVEKSAYLEQQKRIEELESALAVARGALEFYAVNDTWINYGTAALEDHGDVARSALNELGE